MDENLFEKLSRHCGDIYRAIGKWILIEIYIFINTRPAHGFWTQDARVFWCVWYVGGSIDDAVGDNFIHVPCFEAQILFAASDLVDPDIATFDCTQLEDHEWFMAIFVFAKPIISLKNTVFNEEKFWRKGSSVRENTKCSVFFAKTYVPFIRTRRSSLDRLVNVEVCHESFQTAFECYDILLTNVNANTSKCSPPAIITFRTHSS